MIPFTILKDRYDPPRWNAKQIGEDLCALTKAHGLIPLNDPNHRHQVKAAWCDKNRVAYVRRRTVRDPRAKGWHQDGDMDHGKMDSSMVLWASNTPTEIKSLDGSRVYRIPNRSVVLVPNLGCYHRRPGNAPHVRWLFRQRVENMQPNEWANEGGQ